MKVTFEIKTTCSKPFYITVCEETPMFEVRKIIMSEIDYHTMLVKDDVIDLFIPDGHDCVSIPELSADTVGTFINRYPNHFNADKNTLCEKRVKKTEDVNYIKGLGNINQRVKRIESRNTRKEKFSQLIIDKGLWVCYNII